MAETMTDENSMGPSVLSSFEDHGKFASVPLEMLERPEVEEKNQKAPKRVLYFSDGVLEEYSSDEEAELTDNFQQVVDPRSLKWGPWCYYYVSTVALKTLSAADFCGEKLAWFFGITSPKYGYALEEHKQNQKELEEEQAREKKLYEESQGLSAVDVQVVVAKESTESSEHPEKQEEKY